MVGKCRNRKSETKVAARAPQCGVGRAGGVGRALGVGVGLGVAVGVGVGVGVAVGVGVGVGSGATNAYTLLSPAM